MTTKVTMDLTPVDILIIEMALCKVTDRAASMIHHNTSQTGTKLLKPIKHGRKKSLEREFHLLADKLRNEYDFQRVKE